MSFLLSAAELDVMSIVFTHYGPHALGLFVFLVIWKVVVMPERDRIREQDEHRIKQNKEIIEAQAAQTEFVVKRIDQFEEQQKETDRLNREFFISISKIVGSITKQLDTITDKLNPPKGSGRL